MSLPMLQWSAEDSQPLAELGQTIKTVLCAQPQSAVAKLVEGKAQPRMQIIGALPSSMLEFIERLGLVVREGDDWAPRFQGGMIGPHLIFSDLRQSMRVVRTSHDRDTYVDPLWEGPVMSNFLIRGETGDGLDMGCGCGIIALSMSSYCRRVVALDINPRALMLARFNVAVNGIKNVEVLASDLFSAVQGVVFDRIVFNTPVGMELLPRNALESGEQILVRFFRELSTHLNPAGVVQLNLCVKDWSKANFLQNLRVWLGENASEYQSLFLELWRIQGGLKFHVRRFLASFILDEDRGKLFAIRRGQLFLKRNNRPQSREFATRYSEWGPLMGPEFGEHFICWALNVEELPASRFSYSSTGVLAQLDEEKQSLASALFEAFRAGASEVVSSRQ